MVKKVWNLTVGDPQAKLLLLKLADYANDKGKCWPSISTLSRETELSESTIYRKLGELESANLISRSRGINQVFYTLNPCHSDTPNPCQADTPVTVTPLSGCEKTPVRVTVTKKRTIKNLKSRGSLSDFRQFASSLGLPLTDGDYLHAHFEENGWKRGNTPIRDWKASMRKWKVGGWLPSQKLAKKSSVSLDNLFSNQ